MSKYMLTYQRFYILLLTIFLLVGCGGENTEGNEGNSVCEGGTRVPNSLIHFDTTTSTSPMFTPAIYIEPKFYSEIGNIGETEVSLYTSSGSGLLSLINTLNLYIPDNGVIEKPGEWEDGKAYPPNDAEITIDFNLPGTEIYGNIGIGENKPGQICFEEDPLYPKDPEKYTWYRKKIE